MPNSAAGTRSPARFHETRHVSAHHGVAQLVAPQTELAIDGVRAATGPAATLLPAGTCVPRQLLLFDTRGKFPSNFAKAAYGAAGKSERLRVVVDDLSDAAVADWLVAK